MYRNEIRKLTRFMPMWIFLALCLVLNIIITFNSPGPEYFNEISLIAKAAGQKMNGDYAGRLDALPSSDIKADVEYIAEHIRPIYGTYDVESELTGYYTNIVSKSPKAVSMLEKKYAAVQGQVDHLAVIEADMDLYAGPVTDQSYKRLFYTLMKALSAETCIIGMLLSVYLVSYEKMAGTEQFFSSTRIGRKICICKIITALMSTIAVYVILNTVSLGIYFLHWDYSGIWDANISSQFHTVTDLTLTKPFITVADFSVKGYLMAAVALGFVLVATASLCASIIGILVKNNYVAGLLTLLIPALGLFVTTVMGDLKMWPAYLYSLLQPVCIWLAEPVWFTEGGFNAPCLWFEVKGLLLSLALFLIALYGSVQLYYRKDVA